MSWQYCGANTLVACGVHYSSPLAGPSALGDAQDGGIYYLDRGTLARMRTAVTVMGGTGPGCTTQLDISRAQQAPLCVLGTSRGLWGALHSTARTTHTQHAQHTHSTHNTHTHVLPRTSIQDGISHSQIGRLPPRFESKVRGGPAIAEASGEHRDRRCKRGGAVIADALHTVSDGAFHPLV